MWWQVNGDKTGDESLVGTVVKELGELEKSKNHPSSEYENIKNGMTGEGEESASHKSEEHIDPTEVRTIAPNSTSTSNPSRLHPRLRAMCRHRAALSTKMKSSPSLSLSLPRRL
jgi:hypothetical protein